jgi:hypothetical protein
MSNAQAEATFGPPGDRLDDAAGDLSDALDRAKVLLRESAFAFTPADLIAAASAMLESSDRIALVDAVQELATLLRQLSTPIDRARHPREPPRRALRFVRTVA